MPNCLSPLCFCGSKIIFKDCCQKYLAGTQKASTALELMRSRYSAFVTHDVDYLWETTENEQRKQYSKIDILDWATSNKWQKLEIISFTENTVHFKAHYFNNMNQSKIHHELSYFKLVNGLWYYVNGKFPTT